MKFDDILKSIGEFGPYQIRIYLMVCLIGVPVAMNQMAQVFLAARTDHWCAVEEWDSDVDECADLTGDAYLGCIHKHRNASIPIEEDDDGKYYSQCQKFDANYPEWDDGYYAGKETNETIDCDEGWVYDQSEYTRTIRTDVCISFFLFSFHTFCPCTLLRCLGVFFNPNGMRCINGYNKG